MAKSHPPDVVILDSDSLVHARLGRGAKNPRLVQAKSHRLPAGTFGAGMVTPELANEAALAEVLRRLRMETGKWDRVSVLLPDSWFRMNLLDLPAFNERGNEALEVVRWSLKRTLPIPPEELRVAYEVLSRTPAGGAKLLAVTALEKTLAAIERVFAAEGFEVVLIEPIGLNIWNAITVRETATAKDRLFLYVRDDEFTTAVFRGSQPLFIRSRNFSGERTLQQEIRLSASYLRDTLRAESFESCYVAASRADGEAAAAIAQEFSSPVRTISLRDFLEHRPDIAGYDAELTACTGVFTG